MLIQGKSDIKMGVLLPTEYKNRKQYVLPSEERNSRGKVGNSYFILGYTNNIIAYIMCRFSNVFFLIDVK